MQIFGAALDRILGRLKGSSVNGDEESKVDSHSGESKDGSDGIRFSVSNASSAIMEPIIEPLRRTLW